MNILAELEIRTHLNLDATETFIPGICYTTQGG